ncbi:exodeoxyribonuclease V subunit beta [Colwellia asteriadis]|uniref:RecBCD enzyme subunit RecB n=1 Tax=Colwellia asteriadis TaxID=517723 RepID=A0ABN1L7Y5_9GAMM
MSLATSPVLNLKNLNAATLELSGKHLIEASAGTGKTYNITRIYLRLLLERELKVEQILLMTFTKDATEELRGRIDSFLREALSNWQGLCESQGSDGEFFTRLNTTIDADKREFLLKRALLFLDEAAIFTIHGFCQRVLNQYAFSSGLPFNANMAADTKEIILQACQDWYRQLAKNNSEQFRLLANFWATPSSFLSSFNKAIGHSGEIALIDVNEIKQQFSELARQAKTDLASHNALLETALILVKKGAEQETRRSELAQLILWLESVVEIMAQEVTDEPIALDKMPDAFFDGKRYGRSKFKEELLVAFDSVKAVKEQYKTIHNKIDKAKAYQLVRSGIYQMRATIIEQKQLFNMLDFDDLINTLAQCLANDEQGVLAAQLLAQYPVALVDEFQDTDPKQFGILQALYYGKKATQANAGLFLIGDPKQAIYGFRGGDIFAYLSARAGCDYHWLMDTNWRSTPEMIAGYNQIFVSKDSSIAAGEDNSEQALAQDQVFGYGIPYLPVLAGKKSSIKPQESTVLDSNKALQFIHFNDEENDNDKVGQSSRTYLASWCAAEISKLLSVNHQDNNSAEKIRPKDIALLVRDGAEAREIKQALQHAGLDSVFMSDRANLFYSAQAGQLLSLLKGILLVENERLFIAALGSGLLGFSADKLAALQQDEQAYQHLKFAFVDYRQQWQRQGFITMAINLMHQHFVVIDDDKDRALTNLLHLFEVLQAASQRHHQGQELLFWFEQQCRLDNPETEAELRLESDGDLIRIITQHGSKGLEYPYVFIPFATRHKDPMKFGPKSVSYIEYHDSNGQLILSLDGSKAAKQAMAEEAYAESIRLLYVAITRAEKRCYVLTTGFEKFHLSPLGNTLKWREDDNIITNLQSLKALCPDAIGITELSFSALAAKHLINKENACLNKTSYDEQNPLQASRFIGNIERDWWLSSFSALTRNIRHSGVSTPDRDADLYVSSETTAVSQSIRFKLSKGAHSGNLLHDIFELTDFSHANWQESIKWPLVKYGDLNQQANTQFSEDDLITWLDDVIAAPFIGENEDIDNKGSLSSLSLIQTMRESEFYFPMQGEDSNALAKILTEHRKIKAATTSANTGDINIARAVQLPSYKKLSGMMHGFIDLVFEHQGKYYLCDYKSSHLGDRYSHYQPAALLDNMQGNYYDLQYLIYALALHRHLQQSLPDYQPEAHFGGVYYLYLRGMTANPQHAGAGIYYSAVTPQELTLLDQLFSGEKAQHSDTPVNTTDKNIAKAEESTDE